MAHTARDASIARFVARHADLIPYAGPVLDLACGGGRHAAHLLALGHRVVAVDIDLTGTDWLAGRPRFERHRADLERDGWPFAAQRYAGIVVTNYLWRPILHDIAAAIAPGGALIYETFAVGNERFGRPSNPDFLLRPGELLQVTLQDFEIRAYHHGLARLPRPAIRQGLAAIRREA